MQFIRIAIVLKSENTFFYLKLGQLYVWNNPILHHAQSISYLTITRELYFIRHDIRMHNATPFALFAYFVLSNSILHSSNAPYLSSFFFINLRQLTYIRNPQGDDQKQKPYEIHVHIGLTPCVWVEQQDQLIKDCTIVCQIVLFCMAIKQSILIWINIDRNRICPVTCRRHKPG